MHSLVVPKNRGAINTTRLLVDYVEDIDGRRFVAAVLEGVRLIDNIECCV